MPARASLRRHIFAVVLGGAIMPLAIAGWWLAHSAVRSAEGLLRSQLQASLTAITAGIEDRWSYRQGELHLLAENDVVARTLADRSAAPNAADSAYMDTLYAHVKAGIPRFHYTGAASQRLWSFDTGDPAASEPLTTRAGGNAGAARRAPAWDPVLTLQWPVPGTDGRAVGHLVADVRMNGLMAADSTATSVRDAELAIVDLRTDSVVTVTGATSLPRTGDGFTEHDTAWVAVHQTLADPALELTLAAPSTDYVAPFARSVPYGIVVLLLVTIATLGLTWFFTARTTRSLEQLAVAVDAVAGGDLQHHVDATGTDEVAHVARSFNTMTESLRTTLRELSQRSALAAVGEFGASLSHEVRNALSSVRLDLQQSEEHLADNGAAAKLVGRALNNVRQLDATVTSALAVARGGQVTLKRVDLQIVIAAAAAAADGAFVTAHGVLTVAADRSTPQIVNGDAGTLEQLFLNLLLNAAHALRPGGEAVIGLEADDAWVTVIVTDSGSGMAAAELARLSQPFYTARPGGTGLGLTIVRRIATAHGGSIEITSNEGVGTVVRVRLPLASPPM